MKAMLGASHAWLSYKTSKIGDILVIKVMLNISHSLSCWGEILAAKAITSTLHACLVMMHGAWGDAWAEKVMLGMSHTFPS